MVSEFLGCLVSAFLGFLVSKLINVLIDFAPISQNVHFISKIFKNWLDGSSGFAGNRFSKHVQTGDFEICNIKIISFTWFCIVLVLLEILLHKIRDPKSTIW